MPAVITNAPRHVLLSPKTRRPRNVAPPSSGRFTGFNRSRLSTGAWASAAPSTGRKTQMAATLAGAFADEADQLGVARLEALDRLAGARAEVDHGALVGHVQCSPLGSVVLPAAQDLDRCLLHPP